MIYFVLLLTASLYARLCVKNLEWGLMFLLAMLPSYLIRFSVLGIPFTLLEIMILVLFAVWLLSKTNFLKIITFKHSLKDMRAKRKNRKAYPFGLEMIGVLIFSYIAMIPSGFSNGALGIWKAYFFEPILVYILILNIFKGKDLFKKVLAPLSISMLGVCLLAIYQKMTGDFIANPFWAAEETRRVVSVFGYPNAVGLYLAPLLMLLTAWCYANFDKVLKKVKSKSEVLKADKLIVFYTILLGALSLTSIYFAKSEGALIGAAAGLFLFGLLVNKPIRILSIGVGIVVAGGIYFYAPANGYFSEKLALKDLSGEIRKQQWKETWEMIGDGRIFSGAGLDNYKNTMASYHQEGIFFNIDKDPDFRRKIVNFDDKYKAERWQPTELYMYPHTFVLNFWSEIGLLGLLAFVVLIARFYYFGLKNISGKNKYLAMGLVCAMTAIVVHGLVDVPYFKNDLAVMFWVMIAMMGLLKLRGEVK